MASRSDLLLTQAVHACLGALGATTVMGDWAIVPDEHRGVWMPEYQKHTIYSDTVWTEGDGRKVRRRVVIRFGIEEEEL